MDVNTELSRGLETAFIDNTINSNLAYQPEFVSNDYKRGKKVQANIEQELRNCDEFCMSVAFITDSGIAPFLQILKELEEKNVPGKILTTDYLMFSKPRALRKLASLKNIELRMYLSSNDSTGFHTKGYIFEKQGLFRIIIGSSNLTGNALSVNKEWNTKLVGTRDGAVIRDVLNEFDAFWNDKKHTKAFEEFIEDYETKWKIVEEQKKLARQQPVISIEQYKLEPNKMQVEFIKNLKILINKGEKKGLLLSATGERGIFVTGGRNLGFTRVSEAWS